MKKHELDAAIAAAQAELERLQAMKLELEIHPMTLPLERVQRGYGYLSIGSSGNSQYIADTGFPCDDSMWKTANYYASEEQATAYADAFEVLRLIRRQPGIVDPSTSKNKYKPAVSSKGKMCICWSPPARPSNFLFPCFESEQAAQAAIDAVGAERMIKAAKWLAGVVE